MSKELKVAAVDTAIAESGMVISTEELTELPVARSLNSVTSAQASFGVTTRLGAILHSLDHLLLRTPLHQWVEYNEFRNGLGFSVVPFEFYESIQVKPVATVLSTGVPQVG